VLAEDRRERREHGLVIRVAGRRRVGRRAQAAGQPLEVEFLRVREDVARETAGEEAAQDARIDQPVVDLPVVDPVAQQQVLVRRGEGGVDPARVPEQADAAAAAQDARELGTGALKVEPVERLPGRDQVDARIGEGRCFGRRRDAVEPWIARQPLLQGTPHLRVRLDGEHLAAQAKERLGREAGPRADVRHSGGGRQSRGRLQLADQRVGVARAPARVVGHAVGEAPDRVRR